MQLLEQRPSHVPGGLSGNSTARAPRSRALPKAAWPLAKMQCSFPVLCLTSPHHSEMLYGSDVGRHYLDWE